MRINGYRCDTCCKEHLLNPMLEHLNITHGMPADWLILRIQLEQSKEPLLFCSIKCLWDWAEKQITGVKEVVPLPEENTRWEKW
jgi:hypothetical protein